MILANDRSVCFGVVTAGESASLRTFFLLLTFGFFVNRDGGKFFNNDM